MNGEEMEGIGIVFDQDSELGPAKYNLSIKPSELDVPNLQSPQKESIPGHKTISGTVLPVEGAWDHFRYFNDGTQLSLMMEDGKCLGFSFKNPAGEIILRTGIHDCFER